MTRNAFVARYGGVYEHSPWIAEAVWDSGGVPNIPSTNVRSVTTGGGGGSLRRRRPGPPGHHRLRRGPAGCAPGPGHQSTAL